MSGFVVELKNDLPVSEVGGKAHSLGLLLNNGFDVPPGFVVTSSAFFDFLKCNGLFEQVQRLASETTQDNFKEKSAQARETILKGEISEILASEIGGFLGKLGAKYVSIRSSAVSEDSLKASFAGLFDTFLNIKAELPQILESVKRCWASLFNERAVAYRIRIGIPHLECMAVIIQQMVPAEISGTAFTAYWDTKYRDVIIIESSWGLGEAVVSGLVTPDRYMIRKKDLEIVNYVPGRKKLMMTCQENGTVWRDTPQDKTNILSLDNSLAKTLARICLNIERLFGRAQDVEWCVSEGKVWVLQTRPITTFED
jgi:pyruvate,water dikinase